MMGCREIRLVAGYELRRIFRQRFFLIMMLLLSVCSIVSLLGLTKNAAWECALRLHSDFPQLLFSSSVFSMFFLFFVLNYSVSLFRSVNAERESRLSEFYLSFLSPEVLLYGKVLAYSVLCAAHLLLMEIVAFAAVAPHCESVLPLVLLQLGRFSMLVAGFCFYMSLFALAASWAERHAEMQGVMLFVTALCVLSYFAPDFVSQNRFLMIIPFTAPFMATENLSLISLLSLAVILCSIYGIMKYAGVVYKKRLFYYGKNKIEKRG